MGYSWPCVRSRSLLMSRAQARPCGRPHTGERTGPLQPWAPPTYLRVCQSCNTGKEQRGGCPDVLARMAVRGSEGSPSRLRNSFQPSVLTRPRLVLQADCRSHWPLREDALGTAQEPQEPDCDASTAHSSWSSGGAYPSSVLL